MIYNNEVVRYKTIKLPGLIDVHVHTRDPGEEYKEDWTSVTKAALAGGITTILAMPNTNPSLVDSKTYELVDSIASKKAHCDYGLYIGATAGNTESANTCAEEASSLKMYLNNTHGSLKLPNMGVWEEHIRNWNRQDRPICVHAEASTLAAVLFIANSLRKPIHVCHVSTADEINLVKLAKQSGMSVTCEVAPHHLFLTEDCFVGNGTDRMERMGCVKPPLGKNSDVQALWDNLNIIDCFATDHAPHTIDDKCDHGCPGFPGLETALPLLLSAVHDGRLTIEDIILRYHTNPARIFDIPVHEDTYIEVYMDYKWTLPEKPMYSKCGWSPFAGKVVHGYVNRVVIRGQTVLIDGKIINTPGSGKNVRNIEYTEYAQQSNKSSIGRLTFMEDQPTLESYKPRTTMTNLVSISQLDKDVLTDIFEMANEMKRSDETTYCDILKGKVLGLLFYETSTRTRCSFESAMLKLGGKTIHIPSSSSSVQKGESLQDTIRTIEQYCDAIVLRHPDDNSSRIAESISKVPIINAGAGAESHPTQAVLDLYTIREEIGTLNSKCITFVGDLKYGRTVHSLVELLITRKNIRLKFVSPVFLAIPEYIRTKLRMAKIEFTEHLTIEEVIDVTDVLYVTRVQCERMTPEENVLYNNGQYDKKNRITPHTLSKAKSTMCILHPLPRVSEIAPEVDTDPRAAYFRQMKNGLYVRMAILKMILQK